MTSLCMCYCKKNRFCKKKKIKGLLSALELYSSLIGLNVITDKGCFNPNVFVWLFRLLLEMFLMFIKLCEKDKKLSVVGLIMT